MSEIISEDPRAPFGYDGNGSVVAPFGMKADGNPRLSNRGRSAGQGFGAAAPAAARKQAAPARKKVKAPAAARPAVKPSGAMDYQAAASGLWEMLTLVPQLLAADPGGMVSRMGPQQPMAFAGDAAIMAAFNEPIADAAAEIATVNPWLANILEGGSIPKPYLHLGMAVFGLTKALISNHMNPSAELAAQGSELAMQRGLAIKRQIEEARAQEMELLQESGDEETLAAYSGALRTMGVPESEIPGQSTIYDEPAPEGAPDFAEDEYDAPGITDRIPA